MPTTSSDAAAHAAEVASGQRFEFGDNWREFLEKLDDERIERAEQSLRDMLGRESLDGQSFLDVGCGSGLFSLAAVRLGARVKSFDFDPASVECAQRLRERYGAGAGWEIEQGSALDRDYLATLGTWDVVYSWGVLHHTGAMWDALGNVEPLVAPGGRLFIAIYNDQGRKSRIWTAVKRGYNAVPAGLRMPYLLLTWLPREAISVAMALLRLKPTAYVRHWTEYHRRARGMSRWHDIVDWYGGYPFEVASPDEIFEFYRRHGFALERMTTKAAGSGCNEYVFSRPRD